MENECDLTKQREKRRIRQLRENEELIESFISYCHNKQINLTKDNFDYFSTIGIVANLKDLVYLLNDRITPNKDGLFSTADLQKEYTQKNKLLGYYFSEKYMLMAHPYFRRGHRKQEAFAPKFIPTFLNNNLSNVQKYIAIDTDRVRIDISDSVGYEFDTWYGAKFDDNISEIEDGIVKLKLPSIFYSKELSPWIGYIYSLDIIWTTKNGIKTFQAEDFKTEECKIIKDGKEYFPARYLHAEFDINAGRFRHLDGAIHFYTEEEYYLRRDSDFNYNRKNSQKIKTLSQKLFRIDGVITVDVWFELVSQYLQGNPLISEYFEGKLPNNIQAMVKKIESEK